MAELQAAGPAPCPAGPGDVECDFCTGRKLKAVKSCLVCLVSFCETHLQPHYTVPALMNHKLTKASRYLQEQICSQHEKLLEVYCRTDQQCICMLCTLDQHRGHDAVSATAERNNQQALFQNTKETNQQQLQEIEGKLNQLINAEECFKSTAREAVRYNKKFFAELISFIEMKGTKVEELILKQAKDELGPAIGVKGQLEEEVAELRRRNTKLEELSHSEDHVHFLKNFQPLSAPFTSAVSDPITAFPGHSFENVVKSFPGLRAKVEQLCNDEISSVSDKVKQVTIIDVPSSGDDDFGAFMRKQMLANPFLLRRLAHLEGNI